jgi:hypothetical protein
MKKELNPFFDYSLSHLSQKDKEREQKFKAAIEDSRLKFTNQPPISDEQVKKQQALMERLNPAKQNFVLMTENEDVKNALWILQNPLR